MSGRDRECCRKRKGEKKGCNSIWGVITSFLTYWKMYSNISQRNASTSCGSTPAHWLGHNHTLKCFSDFTVSIKWKLGVRAVAICNLRKGASEGKVEMQWKSDLIMIAFTPFAVLFQLISLLVNSILVFFFFFSGTHDTIALSGGGHSNGLDYTVYNRILLYQSRISKQSI